jgi:hypothetical protein
VAVDLIGPDVMDLEDTRVDVAWRGVAGVQVHDSDLL